MHQRLNQSVEDNERASWRGCLRPNLHRRRLLATLGLLALTAAQSSATIFDFESQTSTTLCGLSELSLTKDGVTMTIRRNNALFGISHNAGAESGKPASWALRSLHGFCTGDANTGFVANFSPPIAQFGFAFGDYYFPGQTGKSRPDADTLTVTLYSGPNGTGTVVGSPFTLVYPADVGFPNAYGFLLTQSIPFQSAVWSSTSDDPNPNLYNNSLYFDDFEANLPSTPTPTPTPTATPTPTPVPTPTPTPCIPPLACVAAPCGVVAWYPGDGNASDIVGGNDGAPQNGPTFTAGKVAQAFHFDGSNYFVTSNPSSAAFERTNAFSIEAWIRTTETSTNHFIVAKRQQNAPFKGYALMINNGQTPKCYATDPTPPGAGSLNFLIDGSDTANCPRDHGIIVYGSTKVNDGQWHHVSAIYDGSSTATGVVMFVDGVLETTSVISDNLGTNSIAHSDPFTIGAGSGNGPQPFNGDIDEVKVFNRALTASEVLASRTLGSAGHCKPACLPVPANAISWYSASGTAGDAQGSNHGTLQGDATYAAGKAGQAFNFDGSNDYVLIPNSASLQPQQLTLETWVYPRSPGDFNDAEGGTIFTKDFNNFPSANGVSYALLGPGNTGQFEAGLRFTDGSSAYITSSPHCSIFNTWHHVSMTWNGTTLSLYLNGTLEASVTPPDGPKSIAYNTLDAAIGRQATHSARSFDGLIDELTLYGRALSQAEIQAIASAEREGKCNAVCTSAPSGLVGWFAADGHTADLTGRNHGHFEGAAAYGPGKVGAAFRFNGTDAYVQAPSIAAQDPTTAGSLDAWVFFEDTPAAAGHIMEIIGRGGSGTDFDLQVHPDNRFYMYIAAGNNVSSSTVVTCGVWYHVAGTWDATGLRIYVNGVLENTNPIQNLTRSPSGQPLQIGNQPVFGPRLFKGRIDEAEIFDRALSSNEIAAIVNAGGAGQCAAPFLQALLGITSITKSGNQITLTGRGIPGQIYVIKANNDLSSTYQNLGNTSVTNSNGQWTYQETLAAGTAKRFYRAYEP